MLVVIGVGVGTFEALKSFADFSGQAPKPESSEQKKPTAQNNVATLPEAISDELKLNLAYTINLVLPKSDDIAAFNAIFKSLRENLLKK